MLLHYQTIREPATIKRLLSALYKKTEVSEPNYSPGLDLQHLAQQLSALLQPDQCLEMPYT